MYAHVDQLQETVLKARKQEWLLVCRNVAEKKNSKSGSVKRKIFFCNFFRFCHESKLQNYGKKGEMLVVVLILVHQLNFFIFVVSAGISLLSSSLMPYRTLLTSCDDMNIFVVPVFQPHGGKIQQYELNHNSVNVKRVQI